jgi:hypothetical protein
MIKINEETLFDKHLEKLGLGNITIDEEIYKPWVLYDRPRELFSPNEYYFFAYLRSLRERTHKYGFSDLSTFSGFHQSGKSSSACFFAWMLDETFKDNFKKRVVYDPSDLNEYILNADKLHSHDKRNVGCAVVVDEAGNTVEALNYYSEFSRMFSTTLQTMGYLKPRIFFISPSRKDVASSIRNMANTHYNVARPKTTEYSTVSPRELRYNHLRDTNWNKRPVIRFFGEKIMINTLKIHGIPSEILNRYKEIESYKSDMIRNKYEVRKDVEEKNADDIDLDLIVRKVKDNVKVFLNSRENGIHPDALHYQFKIPLRACNVVKLRAERELRQEGYVFPGVAKRKRKDEVEEDE